MNHSADVPSIRIHGTDDAATLFDGGREFSDLNAYLQDATAFYVCSQGLTPDFLSSTLNATPELEDLSEFAHLSTTNQPFFTGHGYSLPYPIQENSDRGLSPSCLGSPIPSPATSLGESLSPASFDYPLSDTELSPSPDTPDGQFTWPSQRFSYQSSESLVSHPSFSPNDGLSVPVSPATGPHRIRATSSPSRQGPVASKAMLEANGRRRRHPAQFVCTVCEQTFTALFSLKRHMQSHTGHRPFACSIPGCPQRFYNNSDCKRHEKSKKRHKELFA